MTKNNLRAEALRKNRNNDGRPKLPLTEKKGYKVTVKFATAEYYSLKAKAKEAGMNLSLFIRNALQGAEVRERFSAEHLRYILQLTGMANNLNQIARKANAGGYTNARSEYLHLAMRIDNLLTTMENDG